MDKKNYNAIHQTKRQMKKKYLRKEKKKDNIYNLLLAYEKNGKIYPFEGEKDIIFNNDIKICSYSGEVNEDKIPHGYGKLSYTDKSLTGNFYHGVPIDSSAVLETKIYVAIANILGYEIIKFEYIRYKKNNLYL